MSITWRLISNSLDFKDRVVRPATKQKSQAEPARSSGSAWLKMGSALFFSDLYDLIVFEAASQVTGLCLK